MAKKSKTWYNFWLLAGLTAATVASFFLYTDKKGISQTTLPGENNTTPSPSPTCNATASEFPMKLGSGYSLSSNATCEKVYVKQIQTIINKFLIDPKFLLNLLSIDGMFGPKTEAAVYRLWGTSNVSKVLYDSMLNYNF